MILGVINEAVNYLDVHSHLTNLIIFFATLLIAWISGAFKIIKGLAQRLDNRLRVRVNPATARIAFLKKFDHDGHEAARFAFCLSLSLFNPTDKNQTIVDFELRFKDRRRRWSNDLLPLTFPSVPRQDIGDNVKFLPVFFSRFPELEAIIGKEFTPNGKIHPNDSQSGYLLFIEEFNGSWLPLITNKGVRIKVICHDLRGRKYIAKGWAKSISAKKMFSFIPGLTAYAEGEKYLSSLHRWETGVDPLSNEGKKIIRQFDKKSD